MKLNRTTIITSSKTAASTIADKHGLKVKRVTGKCTDDKTGIVYAEASYLITTDNYNIVHEVSERSFADGEICVLEIKDGRCWLLSPDGERYIGKIKRHNRRPLEDHTQLGYQHYITFA